MKKTYTKGKTTYTENEYGAFVDTDEYGMAQQKNAISEKQLIKLGYKLISKKGRN